MHTNREVAEVRGLLDRAERNFPSPQSADDLSDALYLIEDLLDASPDPETSTLLNNLRGSHTRRLLERLCDLRAEDFETTYHYLVLLLVTLRPTFDELREQEPELALAFDACLGKHGPSLKSAAAMIDRG